jgi:hypothetical protein
MMWSATSGRDPDLCGAGQVSLLGLLVEPPGEVRVDPRVDVLALLSFW